MNAERKKGIFDALPRLRPFKRTASAGQRSALEPKPRLRLVIIGNGMVSHRLCVALARLGAASRYSITVLGDEPYLAYDRVHLSRYVTGNERARLRLAPRTWYDEHAIELHTDDEAVCVDREARIVTTKHGNAIAYDRLVFATGAVPYIPPIPGLDRDTAYVYRSISDLEAIKSAAVNAKSVAVIGGGLLGLEAAQALKNLGLRAHVIENALYLLPRQLDAGGAALLRQSVEALDIDVSVDKVTLRVDKHRSGVTLHFADDSTLTADMLVVSAGVRPRDGLADLCGMACGAGGGIVVDDALTTSDPFIFAAGDCVNHHGRTYGLVGPGYEMAEVVAANLMGKKRTFKEASISTRLKLLGVDVASLGEALQPGHPLVYQDSNCYRMLNLRNERLIGAIGTGTWDEAGQIQSLIDKKARPSKKQLERFLETGNLFPPGAAQPVTAWPDEAMVCNCVGITCGQLRDAAAGGINTVERIREETGASTVCGSCAPLVAQLLDEPVTVTEGRSGWRALFLFSSLAMLVVGWILLQPPYTYALTINTTWHSIETLWRDGIVKQISGYTLLGLSVMALSLSFRKRLAWLKLGKFASWRAIHTAVGLSALAGLICHTGFHFGSNVNYALMLVFVLLNLLGGVAGITSALESRGEGFGAAAARRWRRLLTSVHIALFLPLPLLLVLHIFAVYYF